ncbi:DUF2157 domain-containing protein [Piscibacillus sp. B03]|uniref:DUF2157 domain-containing protein n=1 Tax=Piscibacillus sp. B03 TaxID=3457430 RepID=UPI003FCECA67
MKRKWIIEESEQWVNEGIIRPEQRKAILSRYQEQDKLSLIFFLSALFIGLACLSLVAANWQVIPELVRMVIIMLFLVVFYVLGHSFEKNNNQYYGVFCYVIALMIFGAGIFLTGQMYHYTMNNVFAFIVWGLAAYLLYLSRPYILIYLTGLTIVSIGTIYGLSNMHEFDWWLFALFIIAYGSVIWIEKRHLLSYFFAIAYIIQLFAFTLEQLNQYYWFTVFILLLLVIGLLVKNHTISQPFQRIAFLSMFILVLFQTMLMEVSYRLSIHYIFYILLSILFLVAVFLSYQRQHVFKSLHLAIFLPVLVLGDLAQLAAYIILYVFSVAVLLDGYHQEDERKFHMGTAIFLITTVLVYVQVAWGFINQSLFFFVGGIILFIIGFLLERKRKTFTNRKRKGV